MLHISLSGLLWTVVNLIVLFLLLKKFLWKPVTDLMESRQEEVKHNLDAAEAQRAQAEASREEYDARLSQAGREADHLVHQARERGNQEYQAILSAAQSDAKDLMTRTQAQLEADRASMLAGARKEVATLALLAAAQVTGRKLDSDDDRAMVDKFLTEAGERT